MRTTPDYIANLEPLSFAFWQKGEETVSINVPVGVVEDMATHDIPDAEMIARYGRGKEEPAPLAPTDPPDQVQEAGNW